MENAFKSDFSPQNEKGEEFARNEKSQQRANMEATGQSLEELQRELINARLVRDKADLYLKQQEIYKRQEGRQ